jgi:glycosyltransferase involved in cell wall biosynthesis
MKITFITSTSYIDTAFPLINELCKNNQIHLIINFSKNTQKASFINIEGVFTKNVIIANGHHFLGDVINLLDDPDKVKITLVYWSTLKIIDFRNWLFIWKIKNLIRNSKVIHIQAMSLFWALALKVKKDKKLIIDYHDPFEHSGAVPSFSLEMIKKIYNKGSQRIIIHNEKQKNEFESYYKIEKGKLVFIPLGVIPLNKLYSGKEGKINLNKNSILFFGRIAPYKGVEYLVEASQIVRKKFPI